MQRIKTKQRIRTGDRWLPCETLNFIRFIYIFNNSKVFTPCFDKKKMKNIGALTALYEKRVICTTTESYSSSVTYKGKY